MSEVLRALFFELRAWVIAGQEPPREQVSKSF
jgi:hypothetical protein